jgi:hypothetical protein
VEGTLLSGGAAMTLLSGGAAGTLLSGGAGVRRWSAWELEEDEAEVYPQFLTQFMMW